ncbi:ABC transporter substrate-binding protein [Bradyrhizobium sp. RDM4]|uniref:ABC transporter substrate-binding protein n=1 Tax=Bradyrhizobium sp. RDM4 TaxID=3378765 RepID=UPI0038FC043A
MASGTTRIAFIVCAAAMVAGASIRAEEAPPLKIGLILPYKGVWAAPVENVDRGFRVALAEFGNRVAGRPVEVVRADDEMTPNVAVQKFNKLVQLDKVDVIGGGVSSSVSIVLADLADRAKKPIVMTNAHADEITGKLCSPYVARTSFSANAFQYGAGQYWARKGVKKVVTMTADYSAGHAFMDAFKRGFEDGGGQVVLQVWTPFQKTRDWSAALSQATATGAEFIYAFYSGSEAVQVVKQHADFGLREKMPLIGDQWVYDEVNWPALGDLVIGSKFVASYLPAAETDANKKFVEAYRQMFNVDPDVNAAMGYDNAKVILLTLQKLGGKIPEDGTAFMQALRTVSYDSPRGKMAFNVTGSAQLEKEYLVEIVLGPDGKPLRKLLDEFAGAPDLPGCTKSF